MNPSDLLAGWAGVNIASPFSSLNDVINQSNLPDTPGGPSNLTEALTMAVNLMIGVGISISICTLAYAFWLYATSAGNPDNISKANKAFWWSIIAGLVTAGAVGVQAAVFSAAGVDSGISNVRPNFN